MLQFICGGIDNIMNAMNIVISRECAMHGLGLNGRYYYFNTRFKTKKFTCVDITQLYISYNVFYAADNGTSPSLKVFFNYLHY